MKSKLILLRHGATAANLAHPARLQGRNDDPPLAPVGVRQAELTRDFLAVRAIDVCYSSPLLRAMQTAKIVAEPHDLQPEPLADLTECDVGRWQGLSWQDIREQDPLAYQQYMKNPARFGYPDGENFSDVHARASRAIETLFSRHPDQTILVVAHHVVNRTFLARLMGLPLSQARRVSLDNCSISVVVRFGNKSIVQTLNSAFHLQSLAA